jgi:NADPH:quinone reductase
MLQRSLFEPPKRVRHRNIPPTKTKNVSIHWEMMFTRAMFTTADIDQPGALLDEVARLIDAGVLKTTLTERFPPINASNLKKIHARVEIGTTRGKLVLEKF